MKPLTLIYLFFFIQHISCITFSEAINNLSILESYIKEYKTEKKSTVSLNHLITSYIREGVYTSTEWSIAGGSIPSGLDEYIASKDKENNSTAQEVRKYREIELPSKEKIDFVHLFAVMNGIEYGDSFTEGYSSLVGWGGDTAQLLQDIKKETGTLDELIQITLTKYLGIKGQFGAADLVSDLDAPVLLSKKKDDNTFSSLMKEYYQGEDYKSRVSNFVDLTFPNVKLENLRKQVFDRYSKDTYINILECKYGVRESGLLGCYLPGNIMTNYKNHQLAVAYAFADYLTTHY